MTSGWRWLTQLPAASCDYAFHVCVTSWSNKVAEEMEILTKEKGENSFQAYMSNRRCGGAWRPVGGSRVVRGRWRRADATGEERHSLPVGETLLTK